MKLLEKDSKSKKCQKVVVFTTKPKKGLQIQLFALSLWCN